MAAITQRSYGLSGPRYGSFAGKGAVGDDGTGEVLLSPPLIEGLGAFATDSYTGSGAILVSPPLVEGTGAFAGVGEESGAGDIQVSPPLVEGLGAFAMADYIGSGEIIVSPPLVEGEGEFVEGADVGSGEILLPPPQIEGEGEYVDPPLGIADLQLSGLQFQATGVYLAFGPCVSTANIDLGPLVSCNTQGQAISANKDC